MVCHTPTFKKAQEQTRRSATTHPQFHPIYKMENLGMWMRLRTGSGLVPELLFLNLDLLFVASKWHVRTSQNLV